MADGTVAQEMLPSRKKKRQRVGRPTGRFSNAGRRLYETPNGELVSERSITMKNSDGMWMNAPSVYDGYELGEAEVMDILQKNNFVDPETGSPVETFRTLDEALDAARRRSEGLID